MLSADLIRKAEEEFSRLKQELVAGRINLDQFHNALKEAKVSDQMGRPWTIGAKSGKWYFHDGKSWVEGNPYRTLPEKPAGTTIPTDNPHPAPSVGTRPRTQTWLIVSIACLGTCALLCLLAAFALAFAAQTH